MDAHRIRSAGEVDLSLERIELAARSIDPVFLGSAQYIDEQLCAALGRRVLVKVETANPIRSFKGRGTDFAVGQLDPGVHIVTASTGNFGQGAAYAGRTRGIPVTVFTPTGVNPSKLDRIRSLGATVIESGSGGAAAKDVARSYAAERPERVFVEDGRVPRIAEGAGTIAVELLREHRPDTIVVPLGDGALITGIARWAKSVAPATRVVGVCATGAPSLLHSFQQGRPVPSERADTIAEGIAVSAPVPESVSRMLALVDDVVLVDDAELVAAMRLALSVLGLVLEPAGAAGLAAIARYDLPGDLLATVLTGSNVHADLLKTLMSEGESQ
jgi:threonine dehydratase